MSTCFWYAARTMYLAALATTLSWQSTLAHQPRTVLASGELPSEDAQLLETLTSTFVVDPRGLAFGQASGSVKDEERTWSLLGWRADSGNDKPAILFSAYPCGWQLAEITKFERIDFVARAKEVYENPAGTLDEYSERQRKSLNLPVIGLSFYPREQALLHAAWLHRIGADDLAAKALAVSRRVDERKSDLGFDAVTSLRNALAKSLYLDICNCYSRHEDADALAKCTELIRLFPEEKANLPQAQPFHDDLVRRKKSGRLGHQVLKEPPADFASWDAARRVEFLVSELDEVNSSADHLGPSGPLDVSTDWRARELIRLGELAVPALLDVVEKDSRYCRLQERFDGGLRSVNPVWEIALSIVRSILRVELFEPHATARTADEAAEMHVTKLPREKAARILREYWRKYGDVRFTDRMMRILLDQTATADAWREAAANLADLDVDPFLSRVSRRRRPIEVRAKLHADIDKINNPTAAEAILGALDQDLASFDQKALADERSAEIAVPARSAIEDAYLFPLIQLGDRRIQQDLTRRFSRETIPRVRRKLAYACLWLGEPTPMDRIAEEVESGKYQLPDANAGEFECPDDPFVDYSLRTAELGGVVSMLVTAKQMSCDRALEAIARSKHPWHDSLHTLLVTPTMYPVRLEQAWLNTPQLFAHQSIQSALRSALDEMRETGGRWSVDKDGYGYAQPDGGSSGGPLDHLPERELGKLKATVNERICDRAAVLLGEVLWSCPVSHPLLADQEKRLAEVRRFYDTFKGRFRPLSVEENRALGHFVDTEVRPQYVPGLPLLEKPATSDDVLSGRAVFELEGKGKLTGEQLPAIGKWTKNGGSGQKVVVVQAEHADNGQRILGVLTPTGPRRVRGEDIELVLPVAPPAAARKR